MLVGLRNYIDEEKLENTTLTPDLISFFTRIGEKVNLEVSYERKRFIENFISSRSYDIMYNYSGFKDCFLLHAEKQNNFTHMLLEYKAKNPDFNFPSKEDIGNYYSDPDVSELPFSLLKIAESLGKKALTKQERIYIKNRFKSAQDSEKAEQDLQIVYGGVVAGQMVMDMSLRSNRILKNCKFLDIETLSTITNDLVRVLVSLLDELKVRSYWLDRNISMQGLNITPGKLFEIIFCRLTMYLRTNHGTVANKIFLMDYISLIINQLLEDDLLDKIEDEEIGGYLRATSFYDETLGKEENNQIFRDFVFDLVDSIYFLKRETPKTNEGLKDLTAPFVNSSYIINLKKKKFKPPLEVFLKNQWVCVDCEEVRAGKIIGDDIFVEEEDEEEFLDECEFDWREGEESVAGIDEGPGISFVKDFKGYNDLQKIRGTAEILMLFSEESKDISECDDKIRYYERSGLCKDVYEFVNALSTKLLVVSRVLESFRVEKFSVTSLGRNSYLSNELYKDNGFFLENSFYKKTEVSENPALSYKFSELNYNRRLLDSKTRERNKEEILEPITKLKLFKGPERTESQTKILKKFRGLLNNAEKINTNFDIEKLIIEALKTIDMEEFSTVSLGLNIDVDDTPTEKWFHKKIKKKLFKSEMQPLNDPVLRSEILTLSKKLLDKIFTNDSYITLSNKKKMFSQINNYSKKRENQDSRKSFGLFVKMLLNEFEIIDNPEKESKDILYDVTMAFIEEEEEVIERNIPMPRPDLNASLKMRVADFLKDL